MFGFDQFVVQLPRSRIEKVMFSSYKQALVLVGRLAVFKETSIISFYCEDQFEVGRSVNLTDSHRQEKTLTACFLFYFNDHERHNNHLFTKKGKSVLINDQIIYFVKRPGMLESESVQKVCDSLINALRIVKKNFFHKLQSITKHETNMLEGLVDMKSFLFFQSIEKNFFNPYCDVKLP